MKKILRKKQCNSGLMPCSICQIPEYLIEHHINGRKIPDFDAEWNKCYICSNCHNKIHRGLIIVEGWLMTSESKKLFYSDSKSIQPS
jgi:Zn-finger protein